MKTLFRGFSGFAVVSALLSIASCAFIVCDDLTVLEASPEEGTVLDLPATLHVQFSYRIDREAWDPSRQYGIALELGMWPGVSLLTGTHPIELVAREGTFEHWFDVEYHLLAYVPYEISFALVDITPWDEEDYFYSVESDVLYYPIRID
jgi:hypothetical protein